MRLFVKGEETNEAEEVEDAVDEDEENVGRTSGGGRGTGSSISSKSPITDEQLCAGRKEGAEVCARRSFKRSVA